MPNNSLRSVQIELTQRDARYILHALKELMLHLESEVQKDPDGDEDVTPMYAEDILSLRDIHARLMSKAVPVFGADGLNVSYEIL